MSILDLFICVLSSGGKIVSYTKGWEQIVRLILVCCTCCFWYYWRVVAAAFCSCCCIYVKRIYISVTIKYAAEIALWLTL